MVLAHCDSRNQPDWIPFWMEIHMAGWNFSRSAFLPYRKSRAEQKIQIFGEGKINLSLILGGFLGKTYQ